MQSEKQVQNDIRVGLSRECVLFRANVGRLYTADGRVITTGLPKGFSDLFGFRRSDGRMLFIEVKSAKGRASKEQLKFLEDMRSLGALAGVARSVDEARRIAQGE